MNNWYKELQTINADNPIIGVAVNGNLFDTLDAARQDLDANFDDGYGGSNGEHFTAWTADRVYFPAVYDGAEWIANVPRNPCTEATRHIGGE